jgi:hypothetical protein
MRSSDAATTRNVMSGIITKGIEWGVLPRSSQNPIYRVKLPKQWGYAQRIDAPGGHRPHPRAP